MRPTAFALCIGLSVSTALSDRWRVAEQTTYSSESETYALQVTPAAKPWETPGHCRGTLLRTHGQEGEEAWSRSLVNNCAPVKAFVADCGRYVVTMDEWGSVGELAVVVYDCKGKLIKVLSLVSLGVSENDPQIERSVSSYWWSKNSICFFGPEEEHFFIRLHWGQTVAIRLSDGIPINDEGRMVWQGVSLKAHDWDRLADYGTRKTAECALELMQSSSPSERELGAMVTGQMKLRAGIPRLRELLSDSSHHHLKPSEGPWQRVYGVRERALTALQEMGEDAEGVVTRVTLEEAPDGVSNK